MKTDILVLIAVCLTSFLSPFMGQTISVAVPHIANDFNVAPEQIAYVVSAYMLCSASFLLPSTAIANRFGYQQVFTIGCLLASILSATVGCSLNYYWLIIARGVQGIAYGLVYCTSMALLLENVSKKQQGFYIGLSVACVYMGLMLSPLIGGLITDLFGWRVIFYFGSLIMLMCFFILRKVKPSTNNRNTLPKQKMAISFISAFIFLIAVSNIQNGLPFILLLGIGTLCLIAYLIYEYRTDDNLLPIRELVANKILFCGLGASTLNYVATVTITMLLSLHCQFILGKTASFTGIILSVQPICMAIIAPFVGKLCAYLNSNAIATFGILLTTFATYLLSLINAHTSLLTIILIQIMMGVGFGLFGTPNTNAVMNCVTKDQYALASGLLAVTRTTGMALGMSFLGSILNHFINVEKGTTLYLYELEYSIHISFVISTFIGIISLICSGYAYILDKKQMKDDKKN